MGEPTSYTPDDGRNVRKLLFFNILHRIQQPADAAFGSFCLVCN